MNNLKGKSFIVIVSLIILCNKHYSAEFQVSDHGASKSASVRKIERLAKYSFRDRQLLHYVFEHHSLYSTSKFQELEFLGDKVISAIVALSTFNTNKRVKTLQKDFEEKTTNEYLAKISKDLGVYALVHHNPSSRSESIAADAFEALVGAMQLDFEQHPHKISPAAIRFVLDAFNMPIAQQLSLQASRKISQRDTNNSYDSRPFYYEKVDQDRDGLTGLAIAGAVGAGIGTLWNWLSGSPDYKKMYEECRFKKNIYKSLCVVMGSMLCWPYISPYFGFTNSNSWN